MSKSNILTTNYKLNNVFKIMSFIVFFAHATYLVIFAVIGAEPLAILNIFSVIIYLIIPVILLQENPASSLCLVLFQLEVMIHAIACIVVLGWGLGFELLFIAFMMTTLFADTGNKQITYFFAAAQPFAFLVLFFLYHDSYKITGYWRDFLFTFNIICVCSLAIVLSFFLEISNRTAYQNAQKERDDIKDISNQDPLTKIYNRHALQEFLDENLSQARNFAVMMGDIDNFKRINDTYGHNVGDLVLVKVANIFKNIFRKNDFLCRWGGEEFLAIICDIDKTEAINVVRRAKETIATSKVKHGETELNVTMTFGLVYCDGGGEFDIWSLIKRADQLLYKGKNSGKNIVMFE